MSPFEHRLIDAYALHLRAKERFQTYVESKGADAVAEKDIRESVPPGLYEHWKSKDGDLKYYVVFGAGCERDVHTPLVAYAALYPPHAGHLAFHHLIDEQRGFLAPIRREVYTGPRFILVSQLTRQEIDILLEYVGELSVITDTTKFRLHCRSLLKKNIPLA